MKIRNSIASLLLSASLRAIKSFRRFFTPANIMAFTALVMSTTGIAVAVGTIGSPQIIDNSIRGRDIHAGAVKGSDIALSTITAAKLTPGARANFTNVSGLEYASQPSATTDSTDVKSASAECPAGKKVTGGGATYFGTFVTPVKITSNGPQPDLSGWWGIVAEETATASSWYIQAQAIYATAS